MTSRVSLIISCIECMSGETPLGGPGAPPRGAGAAGEAAPDRVPACVGSGPCDADLTAEGGHS